MELMKRQFKVSYKSRTRMGHGWSPSRRRQMLAGMDSWHTYLPARFVNRGWPTFISVPPKRYADTAGKSIPWHGVGSSKGWPIAMRSC